MTSNVSGSKPKFIAKLRRNEDGDQSAGALPSNRTWVAMGSVDTPLRAPRLRGESLNHMLEPPQTCDEGQ
jgi:hypothetical protein